jgi:hypothetical protein
MHRPGSVL